MYLWFTSHFFATIECNLLVAQNWAKEVFSNEQQCTLSFSLVSHACLIYSSKGLQHVAVLNTLAYAALLHVQC